MLFQAPSERTRRRSMQSKPSPLPKIAISKKKELVFKLFLAVQSSNDQLASFSAELFLWAVMRKISSSDQIVPVFSAFGVQKRSKNTCLSDLQKTCLTYLPPINAPITEFETIFKLFETLQSRACKAKMPYVNLTLDVGAFINAYKVLCNYPEKFSNVVLHLGDFHFMKELLGVIGKLVSGSGFEDIIFQAEVCSMVYCQDLITTEVGQSIISWLKPCRACHLIFFNQQATKYQNVLQILVKFRPIVKKIVLICLKTISFRHFYINMKNFSKMYVMVSTEKPHSFGHCFILMLFRCYIRFIILYRQTTTI